MKKKNKAQDIFFNFCESFLMAFFHHSLNSLHIASYAYDIEKRKAQKRKEKLESQMIDITTLLPDYTLNTIYDENNNLFFNIYQQIDKLTIKQLHILREYCYILREEKRINSSQIYQNEKPENYSLYIDTISDVIEQNKVKRK